MTFRLGPNPRRHGPNPRRRGPYLHRRGLVALSFAFSPVRRRRQMNSETATNWRQLNAREPGKFSPGKIRRGRKMQFFRNERRVVIFADMNFCENASWITRTELVHTLNIYVYSRKLFKWNFISRSRASRILDCTENVKRGSIGNIK